MTPLWPDPFCVVFTEEVPGGHHAYGFFFISKSPGSARAGVSRTCSLTVLLSQPPGGATVSSLLHD